MNLFIERFCDIVKKHPENTILEVDGKPYASYQAFWDKASALSNELQKAGLHCGDLVALSIPKSPQYLEALLAVWIAGGAFVPLDPDLPDFRKTLILEQAKPRFILDPAFQLTQREEAHRYDPALAYVFFTSGSTGMPKGVMVSHAGIVNVLEQQIEYFQMDCHSRCFFYLSTSFDASISDIGTAFLAGATLCLASMNKMEMAANLVHLLHQNRITHIDLPPSLLPALKMEDMPDFLKVIVIGGEICSAAVVRKWATKYRLINVYGPTEATICTSMQVCSPEWDEPLIGKPIRQISYALFDDELYISGIGLAIGYIGNPPLTEEKFVVINNTRYYKTGDLVLKRQDGNFVYLGRIDRQAKIRGQLVAPEEIENQLKAHPLVRQAAISIHKDNSQKNVITAFVESDSTTPHALKYYLKTRLPAWMIPQTIYLCDTLPTHENGKINYARLHSNLLPALEKPSRQWVDCSKDPVAAKLQKIWQQVLKLPAYPETHQDFFDDLGGDSLNALEMIFCAKSQGLYFPIGLLAELRSIENLTAWLKENQTAISDGIDSELIQKSLPVSTPFLVNQLPEATGNGLFLTGATGFLGIHALSELLQQTDATVVCLVRAKSQKEAISRIETIAHHHDLNLDMSRVKVILGDLSLPHLGMEEQAWEQCCAEISSIYHCGAEVNLMKSYEQLKETNLHGTLEVVRLACSQVKKYLCYASTLSVFVASDRASGTCLESWRLENSGKMYGGYAQTKWAAEYYLHQLADLNADIFRFGLITGHSSSGKSSQQDYLKMFIKGLCTLGKIPENSNPDLFLDCTPVDYAAKAMVYLSLLKKRNTYHIANTKGFSLAMILAALKKLGVQLETVGMDAWANLEYQTAEASAAYMALCRLMPNSHVFQRYRAMDLFQATDVFFDQRHTLKGLEGSSIACPDADEELLEKYIGG